MECLTNTSHRCERVTKIAADCDMKAGGDMGNKFHVTEQHDDVEGRDNRIQQVSDENHLTRQSCCEC